MNAISTKAVIGKNVTFGKFVIVNDNVVIGDNAVIESYCEIGYSNGREKGPLAIGNDAHIRSHSILYLGSTIGKNLLTGHHTVIRENSKIGDGFQLGTTSIVMGECEIGHYVKTGGRVEIGQQSRIGNCVWIYLDSLLINDLHPPSEEIKGPDIGEFAVIGAGSTIFPGVHVGKDAFVGAGCVLSIDLPDGQIAVGNPAKIVGTVSKIKMPDGRAAYPWRYRFQRGYPEEMVARWLNEVEFGNADINVGDRSVD